MKQKWYFLALLLLLSIAVTASCGGDSGGSSDSSSGGGSLYFKSLDLGKKVSLAASSIRAAAVGDNGSAQDGFKVKVTNLELKKSDGTYVSVYSGGGYLETVGTGAGTFADMLYGTMPDAGTYTGLRITIGGFKIKVKIVSGGTTYYTTAQTVSQGSVWTLSTTSTSYDYITVTPTTSQGFTVDFPTSLTVTAGNDVNLIWAAESSGIISYDGTLPSSVTWAQDSNKVLAFLPSLPSKRIQFTLSASTLSNNITLLLNGSGNLLGGYCRRIGDSTSWAINANFMKDGSLSSVLNNGNTASFNVSFLDGDNSSNYYQISGSYDCGTSTSGTYSSLAVTGVGATPYYINQGYTLTTSGSVTCGNIAY